MFNLFKKQKRIIPPNYDYQVSNHDGRLFFRTDDFCIEVRDIKFTVPPKNWTEKKYGIINFTFDIFTGEKFINEINKESFETMIGSWIRNELSEGE